MSGPKNHGYRNHWPFILSVRNSKKKRTMGARDFTAVQELGSESGMLLQEREGRLLVTQENSGLTAQA